MHEHSQKEKLPGEVVDAFRAYDAKKNGLISAKHLKQLLLNWGEQLTIAEGLFVIFALFLHRVILESTFSISFSVDQIFREASIPTSGNSMVKYEDFVKIACAPNPDYY